MLSELLSKKQCASCKFCCSFRRQSAWETPLFSEETIEKLKKKFGDFPVIQRQHSFTYDLLPKYKTDDSTEEVPCPFLDQANGCRLDENDKPFDCKIWPLRIMKKDDSLVIALTPTCAALNEVPIEHVQDLVRKEDAGEIIYREAERCPDIIKAYKEGFPVLMSR